MKDGAQVMLADELLLEASIGLHEQILLDARLGRRLQQFCRRVELSLGGGNAVEATVRGACRNTNDEQQGYDCASHTFWEMR
jgi:hypothetical protein